MYLDAATRKPLVAVLEQQLLARHVAAILEKGFDALVSFTTRSPHIAAPWQPGGAWSCMAASLREHGTPLLEACALRSIFRN